MGLEGLHAGSNPGELGEDAGAVQVREVDGSEQHGHCSWFYFQLCNTYKSRAPEFDEALQSQFIYYFKVQLLKTSQVWNESRFTK